MPSFLAISVFIQTQYSASAEARGQDDATFCMAYPATVILSHTRLLVTLCGPHWSPDVLPAV